MRDGVPRVIVKLCCDCVCAPEDDVSLDYVRGPFSDCSEF